MVTSKKQDFRRKKSNIFSFFEGASFFFGFLLLYPTLCPIARQAAKKPGGKFRRAFVCTWLQNIDGHIPNTKVGAFRIGVEEQVYHRIAVVDKPAGICSDAIAVVEFTIG